MINQNASKHARMKSTLDGSPSPFGDSEYNSSIISLGDNLAQGSIQSSSLGFSAVKHQLQQQQQKPKLL